MSAVYKVYFIHSARSDTSPNAKSVIKQLERNYAGLKQSSQEGRFEQAGWQYTPHYLGQGTNGCSSSSHR